MTNILALAFLVFGLFFFIIGVMGIVRFPDVYSRIHASGKVSMLGLMGLLAAVALLMPEITLKVLALGIFIVVAQPVASHAIASAAYRTGVPMHNPVRDDLGGRNVIVPRQDVVPSERELAEEGEEVYPLRRENEE